MSGRDLTTSRKLNTSILAQPYAAITERYSGFTAILSPLSGRCQWSGDVVDAPARRMDGSPVTTPFGVEMRIE
jgi:hypothetical protein